jgi:hypothetical protein
VIEMYENCTIDCERVPECVVCRRPKKPCGRDNVDNGRCDSDCPGYYRDPQPGHLWPGELARVREEESE